MEIVGGHLGHAPEEEAALRGEQGAPVAPVFEAVESVGRGRAWQGRHARRRREAGLPGVARGRLVGMLRRGAFRVDEVLRVIREAEQWMRGREYSVASDQVLQLAAASRCSAYDCEFVALAQDLGVSLVTADQEVLASFPDTAVPLARFAR